MKATIAKKSTVNQHKYCNIRYDTIRYDTIEEFNVDSKAEYTA